MNNSKRVLVNTIAQYIRTMINMVLSLYTARLILLTLGQSDYGIYSLIAGVVAMLGFVTNSLIATTQRFVSFYQGKGQIEKTKEIFNNSLIIHIVLGLIIVFALLSLKKFLFSGYLNIPTERINAAVNVYMIVVIILFLTFITSPFKALLVSHENIVYISVIEVLDAVLKVVLVVMMTFTSYDKLIFYGYIMLGVQLFNFLSLAIFCYAKYEECVIPRLKYFNRKYLFELLGFAGWRIYGTACQVGRDQGIAVVLNKTLGTVVNAGWGIGFQVSAYSNLLSSAIVNAMTPQIIKAEGSGDRNRSIWLSNILSKIVFFLMSIIGIPFIFEIDRILDLWLVTPPETAALFSRMFIAALLVDSLTIGLTHVNNAIGKIGKYTFVMNTPKILPMVFAILFLRNGLPIIYVCIVYVTIELICSFVRLPLIKEQTGISIKEYFKNVTLKELFPVSLCILTCIASFLLISSPWRFLITFPVSALVYSISFYLWGLGENERIIIKSLAKPIIKPFVK